MIRSLPTILQAARIGRVAIASIPCEVFTEIGLNIKEKSPLDATFTIELANGHYGYLPTPRQHKLGGYETWLGSCTLEIQASEKIEAVLFELLAKWPPRGNCSNPLKKPCATVCLQAVPLSARPKHG